MFVEILAAIEMVERELLLFGAVWMFIGAIDDVAVDLIWIIRNLYRRVVYYRRSPPMRAAQIPPADAPSLLAVFVATWKEAAVIGDMLTRCKTAWAGGATAHRIYVGHYPNDPDGAAIIGAVAARYASIIPVIVAHDGPTTKADCLNHLWGRMLADELASGVKYKAVIIHDAEDYVHRDALALYDRLIEKFTAVQLPVIPVAVAGLRWVSRHYGDEFAEAHGKTLVVREAIGAALPLAGVGCAIERNFLGKVALLQDGNPFDAASLTEDYELGLRVGEHGGKVIMARILDDRGDLVATHACFPDKWSAAIRQKSRWLTGIALAGWDRMGWRGGPAEIWMRLRDRRSILAAIVLLDAYLCLLLGGILGIAWLAGWYAPRPLNTLLVTLLWINLGSLVWRIVVRAAFVTQLYGWREALLSVPRGLVANLIAIFAAQRACGAYLAHCFGRELRWDKTEHSVVPQAAEVV